MACLVTISKDWRGRATPGTWYGHYHDEWHAAYPGAWAHALEEPGAFYAGNRWGSSTLAWDEVWFARHGAKMPKGAFYVRPGHNKIPLTEKLNPSDTGVIRLQFRRERR